MKSILTTRQRRFHKVSNAGGTPQSERGYHEKGTSVSFAVPPHQPQQPPSIAPMRNGHTNLSPRIDSWAEDRTGAGLLGHGQQLFVDPYILLPMPEAAHPGADGEGGAGGDRDGFEAEDSFMRRSLQDWSDTAAVRPATPSIDPALLGPADWAHQQLTTPDFAWQTPIGLEPAHGYGTDAGGGQERITLDVGRAQVRALLPRGLVEPARSPRRRASHNHSVSLLPPP
jgi:hypothetical protein